MRKVVCVVIILMISFTVLYSENDNILEIEGQKIYFSLFSQINYQYYTTDYKKYSDVLRNFYIDIVGKDDPNKIYQSPININLPDSLTTDYFVIKKGYSVVLIDSTDLKYFKINDFKTTTSIEGSGRSRVLFSIPDSIKFNRSTIFLISEDKSVFDNLKFRNTSKIIDSNVELAIYKKITDFFYNNRKILDRQMTNIPKISDTISYDQFENEIIDNFSLNIFQLDSGGFFFEGSCNKYESHTFFAVISEDYKILNYNKHMRFYRAFKLNSDYYFFCHGYLPNTGGNVFFVFKLIDQELVPVFIDGSHSM